MGSANTEGAVWDMFNSHMSKPARHFANLEEDGTKGAGRAEAEEAAARQANKPPASAAKAAEGRGGVVAGGRAPGSRKDGGTRRPTGAATGTKHAKKAAHKMPNDVAHDGDGSAPGAPAPADAKAGGQRRSTKLPRHALANAIAMDGAAAAPVPLRTESNGAKAGLKPQALSRNRDGHYRTTTTWLPESMVGRIRQESMLRMIDGLGRSMSSVSQLFEEAVGELVRSGEIPDEYELPLDERYKELSFYLSDEAWEGLTRLIAKAQLDGWEVTRKYCYYAAFKAYGHLDD